MTRGNADDITWDMIYKSWHFAWGGVPDLARPQILEIQIRRPNDDHLGSEVIDWWPQREIEARQRRLTDFGIGGVFWNTRAGELHTAQMLATAANEEDIAVIWVAAFLRGIEKREWDIWKRTREQLNAMETAVSKELRRRNFDTWHHNSRSVLPVDTLTWSGRELFQPTDVDDIVAIARLQSLVVRGLWTLVRVIKAKSET